MTLAKFHDTLMPHVLLDPNIGLSLICHHQELMQTVRSIYLIKLHAFLSWACLSPFTLATNDAATLNMSFYVTVPGQTSSAP